MTSRSSSRSRDTESSISALWSLAGYIVGALALAVPIGGLYLLTRTRRWRQRHAVRWAGEKPVWFRGAERDIPPELLYPPDTGGRRR